MWLRYVRLVINCTSVNSRIAQFLVFGPFIILKHWFVLLLVLVGFSIPAISHHHTRPYLWPWSAIAYVAIMTPIIAFKLRQFPRF